MSAAVVFNGGHGCSMHLILAYSFLLFVGIPYLLDQLASETNNQPKLSAFFTVRSDAVDGNPATCLTNQMVFGAKGPSVKDGTFVDGNFTEPSESVKDMKEQDGEVDVQENFCGAVLSDPNCNKNTFDAKIVESNDFAVGDRDLVEMRPESSPCQPSVSISSYCIDDQNTKESSSAIVNSSNQKHSTLMDPNFVENYFKVRRVEVKMKYMDYAFIWLVNCACNLVSHPGS